jgi:hypothetical protein
MIIWTPPSNGAAIGPAGQFHIALTVVLLLHCLHCRNCAVARI